MPLPQNSDSDFLSTLSTTHSLTRACARTHFQIRASLAPLSLSLSRQGSVIRDVRLGLGGAPNCFRVAERDPANPTVRVVTFMGSFALVQQAHEVMHCTL